MDRRFEIRKVEGLFNKNSSQRVQVNLNRWIRFRQSRLDWGKEGVAGGELGGGAMAGNGLTSPEFVVFDVSDIIGQKENTRSKSGAWRAQ